MIRRPFSIQELASALKPYILEIVQRFRTESAGVAPSPHLLESIHHGGKLGGTQMPDKAYINDSANAKMTIGITINQGANDDEMLSLKSSDVDHGITDFTETDTFGALAKRDGGTGGLSIRGLTDDVVGLQLLGFGVNASTTKDATALAAIVASLGKKSGTSYGALATDENLLVVRNYTTTLIIIDADGDLWFSGALQSFKNSTVYNVYGLVPLQAPLTSTSWDGDAYSTTSKTVIDLSAVFGAPAGIKAVLLRISIRDSASAANDCVFTVGPTASSGIGPAVRCSGLADDKWTSSELIVPCDSNGDIYYQVDASGSNTMDISMQIWGYWI